MPVCCSQPAVEPNYTICFPDTQIVPGINAEVSNPFYDFANRQSVWTYTVEVSDEAENLGFWGFQVCPNLACAAYEEGVENFLRVERAAEESPGVPGNFIDITSSVEAFCNDPVEPTTGLPYFIKINLAQNSDTIFYYRITILSPVDFDLAATQLGQLAISSTTEEILFTQATCGVNLPPTPAFGCQQVPVPELSIMKACPAPAVGDGFNVGDTVTLTIVVNNAADGNIVASVEDTLNIPAGVDISNFTTVPDATNVTPSPGPGGTFSGNQDIIINWDNFLFSPGVSLFTISFEIDATPVDPVDITNNGATLTRGTTTITTESCTIPVSSAEPFDISITKTCPTPAEGDFFSVGDTVNLEIEVSNGDGVDYTANVTDILNIPEGVTITNFTTSPDATVIDPAPEAPNNTFTGPVSVEITWANSTIPALGSETFSISFDVADAPTAGTVITNVYASATVDTTTVETESCTIPVAAEEPPAVTITKTCPTPAEGDFFMVGDTVELEIDVVNEEDEDLIATVTDVLDIPNGVTITNFTPSPGATDISPAPEAGNTFIGPVVVTTTWANQNLPASAATAYSISFDVAAAPIGGTVITNDSASVTVDTTTVETESCTIPVAAEEPPAVTITKTCPTPAEGDFFMVGDAVELEIDVVNEEDEDLIATVTDVLDIPNGVTITNFTPSPGATDISPAPEAGGTFNGPVVVTTTWANQNLPASSSTAYSISFDVAAAPFLGTVITNESASVTVDNSTITAEGCEIPVIGPPVPPIRGVNFQELKIK